MKCEVEVEVGSRSEKCKRGIVIAATSNFYFTLRLFYFNIRYSLFVIHFSLFYLVTGTFTSTLTSSETSSFAAPTP